MLSRLLYKWKKSNKICVIMRALYKSMLGSILMFTLIAILLLLVIILIIYGLILLNKYLINIGIISLLDNTLEKSITLWIFIEVFGFMVGSAFIIIIYHGLKYPVSKLREDIGQVTSFKDKMRVVIKSIYESILGEILILIIFLSSIGILIYGLRQMNKRLIDYKILTLFPNSTHTESVILWSLIEGLITLLIFIIYFVAIDAISLVSQDLEQFELTEIISMEKHD